MGFPRGEGSKGKSGPDGSDFWNAQSRNINMKVLPGKTADRKEMEEAELFPPSEDGVDNTLLDFSMYDMVPMKITGENEGEHKIVRAESFKNMWQVLSAAEALSPSIADNVTRAGYERPTPVQKYAIPAGVFVRDIMCVAHTGSGKTVAYLVPVIARMVKTRQWPIGSWAIPYEGACKPDTVVLVPTRELCEQVWFEARKFCHKTDFLVASCSGGNQNTREQMEILARGCDILVCTPGRATQFLNVEILDFSDVHGLVLDEADRMLDLGFMDQVWEMVRMMPSQAKRQTLMFSATFPVEIQQHAQGFLYNYIGLFVEDVRMPAEYVTQEFMQVFPQDKTMVFGNIIADFIQNRTSERHVCITFVNTKGAATWLEDEAVAQGIKASGLHSGLRQPDRDIGLQQLKRAEIDVLIATDAIGRGVDVKNCALVINYDMPQFVDDYIHRVGRTGRAGVRGRAMTFIAQDPCTKKTIENLNVLKELVNILSKSSTSTLPEWLQPLIEHTSREQADIRGIPGRGVNAAHRPPVPSLVKAAEQAQSNQESIPEPHSDQNAHTSNQAKAAHQQNIGPHTTEAHPTQDIRYTPEGVRYTPEGMRNLRQDMPYISENSQYLFPQGMRYLPRDMVYTADEMTYMYSREEIAEWNRSTSWEFNRPSHVLPVWPAPSPVYDNVNINPNLRPMTNNYDGEWCDGRWKYPPVAAEWAQEQYDEQAYSAPSGKKAPKGA